MKGEVVAQACLENTLMLLKQAGIKKGLKCLDLGCGTGDVSFEIAKLVGASGKVRGLDMDPIKIEKAQLRASTEKFTTTQFIQGNIFEWCESANYDLIYTRFLLTHLPQAESLIPKLINGLKPGGVLIVEDIDFQGHISHPQSNSYDRYVELYQKVVQMRGGDPNIGPKLFSYFTRSRLQKVQIKIVYPEHTLGKEINLLNLKGISESLLEEQLITKQNLVDLTKDLEKFVHDPSTVASAARVFQAWGYKSKE